MEKNFKIIIVKNNGLKESVNRLTICILIFSNVTFFKFLRSDFVRNKLAFDFFPRSIK